MRPTAILLLFLVVISVGCVGTSQSGQPSTATSSAATTAVPTLDPTLTAAPTATPTPTPRPPQNPWRASPIVVSVTNYAGTDRDYASLVEQATDYWEQNWTQFTTTDQDSSYLVVENANNPDIEVRFVPAVTDCGDSVDDDHTLGCAPLIEEDEVVEKPTVIRIRSGYDDASTLRTIKHEFGHVLGVEHGEGPEFMNATGAATTLPQTNATERAYPWAQSKLSVYVSYEAVAGHDRDDAGEQVGHALDFYEAGADGHLARTPTFALTDDEASADVRIYVQEQLPSGARGGSIADIYGTDPDGDGALEYYTRTDIYLSDIDIGAVGWHVGYWLAFAFNADSKGELPPPFVDSDYETTHGDWWE